MSKENRMTIAEKMTKLDELVAWFDSDNFELEQALDRFKAAEELALEIEEELTILKNDIEVVKVRFNEA